MTPLAIGGATAAVVAVVGIAALAWRLGRAGRHAVIPADALAHAEQALSGFAALGAVVGVDDRAALIAGETGRVAVMAARGRRVIVREVSWPAIRATPGGMAVDTGSRWLGPVVVVGVSVLDVRRITGPAPPPSA